MTHFQIVGLAGIVLAVAGIINLFYKRYRLGFQLLTFGSVILFLVFYAWLSLNQLQQEAERRLEQQNTASRPTTTSSDPTTMP